MARKKTKRVECWEDLTNWIETINPYQNTILLSGFINSLDEETGQAHIKSLIFDIVPVEKLIENDNKTKK